MKLKLIGVILITITFGIFFTKSALADSFSLSGSVKDSSGTAIIGATVSVNGANSDSTTTDSSGNYIMLVPSGVFNVQVTPPSGSNFSSAVAMNQNISRNTTLNFILTPAGTIILNGHMHDAVGNPLANQVVDLVTSGVEYREVTDSSGAYSIQAPSGTYTLDIFPNDGNVGVSAPYNYNILKSNYTLTQDTTLDITIPADKVSVHVQDQSGNPVSNIILNTQGSASASNLNIGGGITNATGTSKYTSQSTGQDIVTDASGDATLWLLPSTTGTYSLLAIPPSGSNFSEFTLNNVSVTGNQTELISLQYNHATPTTIASLLPAAFADGTYHDPTIVTLSATAASGYTVTNIYYTVDGVQHTYTAPFTVTGSGSHTITYWSVDNSDVQETHHTQTFTITEAYSLTGIVYNDANKDGVQDSGETGYANATVTLDSGQSTTTDSNGNYTFSGLEAGTYVDTLTVPTGYNATTTNPATVALAANTTQNFGIAPATSLVTAINAGGDTQGSYVSDTDSSGGSTYSTGATVDTTGVTKPAPQAVYQTVRYGNFSYTIPNLTPNGTYTVRLHFNEVYWGTDGSDATGKRVFNVSVNGTTALTNFDIFDAAGGANKAVVEQVPATADSNGNVTIQFTTVTDNAMVNGIELYSGTLPSPSTTPTPTPVTTEAINSGGNASSSFVADAHYFGGTQYTSSASVDTSGVTNPAPQTVYQSVRYGNFGYTIPTYSPSTSYHVRLHFNEIYWNSAGNRTFNVSINGQQVLNNFDIFQAAGGENKALVEEFNTTSDTNGRIIIQFATVTDNAMVNGIEISKN